MQITKESTRTSSKSFTPKNFAKWFVANSFFTSTFIVAISQFCLIWWLRYNRDVGGKIWMIGAQTFFTVAVFVLAAFLRWRFEVKETLGRIASDLKIPYFSLVTKPSKGTKPLWARPRKASRTKRKENTEDAPASPDLEQLEQLLIEGSTVKNFLFLFSLLLASVAVCVEVAFFMRFRPNIEFDTYSSLVTIPLTFLIAGSVPYYLELFKRISAKESTIEQNLSQLQNSLAEYERHAEPIWQFYKNTISDQWANSFQETLYQIEWEDIGDVKKRNNFRKNLQKEINVYSNGVRLQSKLSKPKLINENLGVAFTAKTKRDELAFIWAADQVLSSTYEFDEDVQRNKEKYMKIAQSHLPVTDKQLISHRLDTWIHNHTLCRVEASSDGEIYPLQASFRLLLASDLRDSKNAHDAEKSAVVSRLIFFIENEVSEIKINAINGCAGCRPLIMFLNDYFGSQGKSKTISHESWKDVRLERVPNTEDATNTIRGISSTIVTNNLVSIVTDRKRIEALLFFLRKVNSSIPCAGVDKIKEGSSNSAETELPLVNFERFLSQCTSYYFGIFVNDDKVYNTRFHTWLFPTDERIHFIVLNRLLKWTSSHQQGLKELLDHETFASRCESGTGRHMKSLPDHVEKIKKHCGKLGLNYHAFTEDAELFSDLLSRYSLNGQTDSPSNEKEPKNARDQDLDDSLLIRNLVYALAFSFASDQNSILAPMRFQSVQRYIQLSTWIENHRNYHDSVSFDPREVNVIPNGNAAQNLREFWTQLRSTLYTAVYRNKKSSGFVVDSDDQSLELVVLELTHHRGPLQNWIKASNSVNRRHEFQRVKIEILNAISTIQERRILGLPILPSEKLLTRVLNLACEIPEDSYVLNSSSDNVVAPVRLSVVPRSTIDLWDIEDLMKAL